MKVTLINADEQPDGGLVINKSDTAGKVFAVVELDDTEATKAYKEAKAKGVDATNQWDAQMLGQAMRVVGIAASKLAPPKSEKDVKSEQDRAAAAAAFANAIPVPVDQVP